MASNLVSASGGSRQLLAELTGSVSHISYAASASQLLTRFSAKNPYDRMIRVPWKRERSKVKYARDLWCLSSESRHDPTGTSPVPIATRGPTFTDRNTARPPHMPMPEASRQTVNPFPFTQQRRS
jgi:hypothetical protein